MLDSMAYEVNKIISTYRELTIKVEKKATYTQRTIIKGMIFKNHMRKEKKKCVRVLNKQKRILPFENHDIASRRKKFPLLCRH